MKMKTLQDRLQAAMDHKKFSQEDLADKAKVSQVAIHKILSGKTRESKKLPQIADALGVYQDWLTKGDPRLAPGWLNVGTVQEKLAKEPSKIETIADLFESSVIGKLSPQSQDLLEQIQKAIENNTLTDEMAAEIKGYLQIKLSKNKNNKDNEKKYNELKERLKNAQDDTHHGKDHHR